MFAVKLEGCKDATKLDMGAMKEILTQFKAQQKVIDAAIQQKKAEVEQDRQLIMPLLLKDEEGGCTEEEEAETDRLQSRIDY